MESRTPQGPADVPTEAPWEALALLAVLVVLVEALSRARRLQVIAKLELVAADWERHAAELPAGNTAAARFLRPALAMLRAQFGSD